MAEMPLFAPRPTDPDETIKILIELSRALSEGQQSRADEIEDFTKILETISTPRLTMTRLADSIFFLDESNVLPGDLLVLTYLVSSNPEKYLKEASRAVNSAAERVRTYNGDNSSRIAQVVSSQLTSHDVEVSDNASKAMIAMCKRLDIFVGPSIEAISFCWSQTSSAIVAVRCATTLIEITIANESAMDLAVSLTAMDNVLRILNDPTDPLTQMTIIDLLERMATTKPIHDSAARWISSDQVVGPLLEMAGGSGEIDPLLGGPALKLLSFIFSNVRHQVSANMNSNHLQGFKRALHNFDSSGEIGRLDFVDAVSSFASATNDTLIGTLDDPFLREKWLSLASVAQPKLKYVVLSSIARVIDPSLYTQQGKEPPDSLAFRLLKTFGAVNSRDAVDILLSLAKSPIVETRLGSYVLMHAIAKRAAGVKLMLGHKDFFNFLMDRDIETTKEGKESKYFIVKTVLESEVHSMLADDVVEKLQKVVDQGPFFVKTIAWEEMATE